MSVLSTLFKKYYGIQSMLSEEKLDSIKENIMMYFDNFIFS